jgi:conjugative transfer signal peptidase TraF
MACVDVIDARRSGRPVLRTWRPLWVIGSVVLVTVAVRFVWATTGTSLLINTTASEPVGIYQIKSLGYREYRRGLLVVFPVPAAYRDLVYGRRWLGPGWPLLKSIGALAGDQVCIGPNRIEINASVVGPVENRDSAGRLLPQVRGCFTIRLGEFLPLSTLSPRSFDGRYMGPQPLSSIVGEARPLWIF